MKPDTASKTAAVKVTARCRAKLRFQAFLDGEADQRPRTHFQAGRRLRQWLTEDVGQLQGGPPHFRIAGDSRFDACRLPFGQPAFQPCRELEIGYGNGHDWACDKASPQLLVAWVG